jgi:hypothetical protein
MKANINYRQEQSAKSQRMSSEKQRPHWRFEDLEIWKKTLDLAVKFHLIAERLDKPPLLPLCRAAERSWPFDFQQHC